MADEQEIQQIELLCKQLYESQDPLLREQAEKAVVNFQESPDTLSKCQALLERADSSYAQLLAATTLGKLVGRATQGLSLQQRLDIRNYILNYLATRHKLASFVVQALVSLFARITKLGWFDTIKDEFIFRNVMADVTNFLQGPVEHCMIGVQLLSQLTCEMNQISEVDANRSLTKHRKISSSFRDTQLFELFQLSCSLLDTARAEPLDLADERQHGLMAQLLRLAHNCLTYDFIGTSTDESTDDLCTVQIPTRWRPTILEPGTLELYFELYAALPGSLACLALACLVQLASVRRSLFSNTERAKFLNHLVAGVKHILENPQGLSEPGNYHEFCRLLARLKSNYQLGELVMVDNYPHVIELVAKFTVQSLQMWQFAPNSVHYLLSLWQRMVASVPYVKATQPHHLETYTPGVTSAYVTSRLESVAVVVRDGVEDPLDEPGMVAQQLEQVSVIGRCEYGKTCGLLVAHFDTAASAYHALDPTDAGARVKHQILQGQLTWLVYIIGAAVGGRASVNTSDEHDSMDGELVCRVLQLMDLTDSRLARVYTMLLGKLKVARKYTDVVTHGTMKLTAYFGVMSYCVVSRIEKLMFGQYFRDLWDLYHPGISEPSAAVHPNKQALLAFWHAVSVDCPENVQLAVSNPQVCKHIAFNYILADHEDGEVMAYNRAMLPPYYALLRLCCQRSAAFARSLAQHQNVHWAFRNIAPHAHLYPAAADELLRLARVLAARPGGAPAGGAGADQDAREAAAFRRSTLAAYLQGLNGRTCWTTLISAFRTLVETDDDRLYVVYNGGLQMAFEALHTLHALYHEGGGGGGGGELCEVLRVAGALCRAVRARRDAKEARSVLLACKDWPEAVRRLATVLNAHNPPDVRNLAIALLKELMMMGGGTALAALVPVLAHSHAAARHGKPARPPRPSLHMVVPHGVLQHARKQRRFGEYLASSGEVAAFIRYGRIREGWKQGEWTRSSLCAVYRPYHQLVDAMCRAALAHNALSEQLVLLSAMCAVEAVPLRFPYFAALWRDVAASQHIDRKYQDMLLECSILLEYMDAVLLEERETLEDINVYHFFLEYFPKVEGCKAIKAVPSLVTELCAKAGTLEVSRGPLLGDMRALRVVLPRADLAPSALDGLRRALALLLRRAETTAAAGGEESQDDKTDQAKPPTDTAQDTTDCESPLDGGDATSPLEERILDPVGDEELEPPSEDAGGSDTPDQRQPYVALLSAAITQVLTLVQGAE